MNGKLLRRLCAVALSALMICSAGQTAGISLSVFAEGEASNTETDNQLVCTAVCSAGFVPTGGNAVVYCSAEGGGGSYTFAVYTRQSTAAEWTLVQDFSENTSVKVNASQAGEFEIKVIAMDVSGNTSDKIISITAVDKLESAASLSEDVVVLGNTVTIHNETSKGVAPYKYSAYYRIAGNTSWKVISEDSDEPDIDFVPKAVETYEIKSTVRDSSGKDINKEMVLKVISQLKNLSEFSSTSIPVNGSADIHCKAKGGLGSLKFAVSYRLTGANNWSVLQDYSANNEIVFAPGAAGVYEVKVAVMDERDVVVEKKTKITVADTINNLSDISADAVVLGNSITLSGAASGGIAPYTYAAFYRLEGNENWIKFQDYSSNSEIVFTPKGTGTYELRSTVKDSVGKYSRKEFTIQSVSVLKNLSTVSSASIGVSKETNINCTAKGGLGQLKYSVYSRLSSDTEWTAIQELSDNKTVTFSSDTVGVYYIKVDVVDEMGKTVSKQIKVKVADTLENTVELSSDVAVLGETVTIDSEASGGIAPYTYSAFYRLKGNTNWIKLRDYSENSTVEFTPKASGEYELRYNTKDSVGNVVKKESVLKVVSALRNTSLRSAPNVTVGKSIDINCAAKGGLGNYKFAVYARLSGSEDSVMLQDFSENTKVSFAPDKSGVYEITVIATDDMQKTAEKKISVTAIDPLSNIIELSDDSNFPHSK